VIAWQATPARHSIALAAADRPPRCLRDEDGAIDGAPALAFAPDEAEIDAIDAPGLCHATDYGPASQDKPSNEDFALSAVLRGETGERFAFAAVADGVSNGSFFAERGARLACLAALRAVHGELVLGADPGAETARESFRRALHAGLLAALEADLARLRELDAAPAGWAADTFAKYRGETDRWFRTTLLVAVLGARGGFVSVTGDGGVHGFVVAAGSGPEAVQERTLLSAGGGPIERCVSLFLKPEDLTFASLSTEGRAAVHLVVASDGLDASMARLGASCGSRWRDLPLETSRSAVGFLGTLARHPAAEKDNLSVARASWPLDEHASGWGAWARAPIARWLGEEDVP
jgi:hypothetical protein